MQSSIPGCGTSNSRTVRLSRESIRHPFCSTVTPSWVIGWLDVLNARTVLAGPTSSRCLKSDFNQFSMAAFQDLDDLLVLVLRERETVLGDEVFGNWHTVKGHFQPTSMSGW